MPTKPLSTPASQQSNLEKIEQEQERKEIDHAFRQSSVFKARCSKTLRLSSLTSGSATLVGMALFAILGIVVSSNWLWVLVPCSIMLFGFIISFSIINPVSHRRIRLGAYIIMLAGLMGIVSFQLLTGALNTILIGYLWVILLAILAGLTVPEIFGIALLVVLVSSSTILAEHIFKFYQPALSINNQPLIQIFVLITMIGAIVAELMMLVQTLYQALIDTELRAKQALLITQHLSQTNQFGKEASLSLNTIVSELSATSRQQASGAQEQAAAVMEVTSSMSELGETARQIANNSNRVSVAASDGFYSAGRVREATQRAAKTAERGQAAVDSSIQAIEDVRNGITALAERLMTLTERSKQISSIIALIKEIADETHLLALNAAIESAGAGESGRRFSVVASEVKSLADRSLEATTEVAQVINELQGAVAAAVLSSEETRKKTFGAVERSYQAGQVINELGQVVDETAVSANQIVDAVQQAATLSEEIRLATQQQESAIRQIIATMESVGMVAQENASAVTQVSETINRIDNLSSNLKEAFDK